MDDEIEELRTRVEYHVAELQSLNTQIQHLETLQAGIPPQQGTAKHRARARWGLPVAGVVAWVGEHKSGTALAALVFALLPAFTFVIAEDDGGRGGEPVTALPAPPTYRPRPVEVPGVTTAESGSGSPVEGGPRGPGSDEGRRGGAPGGDPGNPGPPVNPKPPENEPRPPETPDPGPEPDPPDPDPDPEPEPRPDSDPCLLGVRVGARPLLDLDLCVL